MVRTGLIALACVIFLVIPVVVCAEENEDKITISDAAKFSGGKYAVLVGIDGYQYLSKLENCEKDARDMKDILIRKCGFSSSNVEILLGSQATYVNIKNAINSRLALAGPNDLIVFYYSGHGDYGPTDVYPYDESDDQDEYICPVNAKNNGRQTNWIRDDELKEWFDAINAKNKLLIFDSCRSGGLIKNGMSSQDSSEFEYMSDFLENQPERGLVKDVKGSPYLVLMACREREFSSPGTPNSIFTLFLLEGFNTLISDIDNDNLISAEEAFDYASPKTTQLIQQQKPRYPMHPQKYDGNSREEIELVGDDQKKPDLVVSSISSSDTTPDPGQSVTVTATVKNQGSANAGSSTAKIYLSTNTIISSSDTYLGYISVGSLSAGQSKTYSTTVTIPSSVTTGSTYYLGVIADANSVVVESDENNNDDRYTAITIGSSTPTQTWTPTWTPTPTQTQYQPDLAISSLSCSPTNPEAGKGVTVRMTINNWGNGNAGASTAKIYLSTNSLISSSDIFLKSFSVIPLSPNGFSTSMMDVTIPSSVSSGGTYYLGVIADANSQVAESNENNNYKSVPITIGDNVPQYFGEKYAVIVGIDVYRNSYYYGTLDTCVNDAQDMKTTLIQKCGFSSGNIQLLTDSYATKNNIKNAIKNTLGRAGPNDLVVFYFSGHSINAPDTLPYDESDNNDEYIVSYDSGYATTCIRDDELKDWLDAINAKNKLLIFDSSYSEGMYKGALTDHDSSDTEFMSEFTNSRLAGESAKDVSGSSYLVLAACGVSEYSYIGSTNSIFTEYLIEGLNSISADTDKDNTISAEEAFYYARPRSTNTAFLMHPQIYDGNPYGEIELVRC